MTNQRDPLGVAGRLLEYRLELPVRRRYEQISFWIHRERSILDSAVVIGNTHQRVGRESEPGAVATGYPGYPIVTRGQGRPGRYRSRF